MLFFVCVCLLLSLSLSIYIYIYIYILSSIRSKSFALCKRQPKIPLPECSTPMGEHIYCHLQTHCFVVSQLFSVSRHVGRLKLGSKPTQLYVRLSIRSLGQQAYHVGKGIIRYFVATAAAAFVYILFPTGYQSAQFVWRALHYASGSWKFPHQSAQPPWGSVYIVIHRQTVSLYHNSSVWLNM